MQINQALMVHEEAEQLFDQSDVDKAIQSIASKVAEKYADKFPLVLCVMNGGLYMTAQLMRHWEFPLTVDYVHATRYKLSTLGQDVLWKAYPQNPINNRHVIIVDDIFDQGFTLQEVKNYCVKQGAIGCSSVFLIKKNHNRAKADIKEDYCALECGDSYVYGSGMDLHTHFRNLSGIYSISEELSGR